jgi:integrase
MNMPRPRLPYLQLETTRHGKTAWYVRRSKGPRTRMRAKFGTPEFDAEYQAAVNGTARPKKGAPATSTLAWLIARYRESGAWEVLSPATRRLRENIFRHVLETAGDTPFVRINTVAINAGIERRTKTPSQAKHFLDSMRGLFKWAVRNNHVKVDPTAGVDKPQQKKTEGYVPWTEEMVEAYERRWPLGTYQRVWLDVLLYTGLRCGDAVRFGRQHVRDGVGRIKTEKTGTPVTLPILPVLAETLAAGPVGDLTFIVGGTGQPLTKGSFGNAFSKACRAAGVIGTAHGVRKIAATRAANAGATVAQLEAIFGWNGGRMASLYTQSADRQRLAQEAMHKLVNNKRTSIPAPGHQVRAAERKPQ